MLLKLNNIQLLFFVFMVLSTVSLKAQDIQPQEKDSILNEITNIDKRINAIHPIDITPKLNIHQIMDSILVSLKESDIHRMQRDKNGLLIPPSYNQKPFDIFTTFQDTVIIDPAFLPVVFDGNLYGRKLDFMPKDTQDSKPYYLINPDSTFIPDLKKVDQINEVRRNYYMNNPDRIKLNAFHFDKEAGYNDDVVNKKKPFEDLLSTENPIEISAPAIEKIEIKELHWTKNGEHSLRISSNSFSDNWSAGNNNLFNINNFHKININYKKDRIKFSNVIEWKLDLQKNQADTLHNIAVMDDYFRINSNLGFDAFIKNWSYAIDFSIRTPLFNKYQANDTVRIQSFLSPLNINTGIGMKYSLDKKYTTVRGRRFRMTVSLLPASIEYTHISDEKVDPTRFGVEKGKNSRFNIGSTINLENITYDFNTSLSYIARLKYFTNYEGSLLESDNRLVFALNKYLSAEAAFNLRFDDRVTPDKKGEWGYFQYNYVLGFGLGYKW